MKPHVDSEVAMARRAVKAEERARFGARVRELRHAAGVSQTELAGSVPMSRVTLSKVENGEHDLAASYIRALADALGVDPGALFRDTTD